MRQLEAKPVMTSMLAQISSEPEYLNQEQQRLMSLTPKGPSYNI